MAETITSAQNPKVRKLLALQQKAAERRESGLFVLEGVRELQHCLSAGYKADSLFVCPEILGSRPDAEGLMSSVPSGRVFEVPKELYARIAYRGGTEGVIAEVHAKERGLESLKLPENPLVLVTESVHILIHATDSEVIARLAQTLQLNTKQRTKLNTLRKTAGLFSI